MASGRKRGVPGILRECRLSIYCGFLSFEPAFFVGDYFSCEGYFDDPSFVVLDSRLTEAIVCSTVTRWSLLDVDEVLVYNRVCIPSSGGWCDGGRLPSFCLSTLVSLSHHRGLCWCSRRPYCINGSSRCGLGSPFLLALRASFPGQKEFDVGLPMHLGLRLVGQAKFIGRRAAK